MAETVSAEKYSAAYLVVGGELRNFAECRFADPQGIEIVGVFADYESAEKAWKGRTMETVDNALQRYWIIDLNSALQQAH